MRDMTKEQFRKACEKYGFTSDGFLGYYQIGNGRSVSIHNAGNNRRKQLAYLIRESNKDK